MTISETTQPTTAYVWVWLPEATEPVVAGRLDLTDRGVYAFTYGRNYSTHPGRIPLYLPELPLVTGRQDPPTGFDIAGALSDAGPDSWGRRVVLAKHLGHLDRDSNVDDLNRITYFLESGSDRIGALDFQTSATTYEPRLADHAATLDELAEAAERIQQGIPLSHALEQALLRGTSIGGARPKALIDDNGRQLIAKFSSTNDVFPMVKAEAVAMDLARRAGVNAAQSRVATAAGKDVLLVERFDRTPAGGRRLMISALTILERPEILAHRATYSELAEEIRKRFTDHEQTQRELFTRIVVNIAVGNTDDHLRNHAAFWDGTDLTLTPAYDIAPQPRSTPETNQAIGISRPDQRESLLANARAAAPDFQLTSNDADEIIDHVVDTIRSEWDKAADEARLTALEKNQLWGRQILNEYIFS
ncbi:type II toxin-antitoxin system HipA family toxin [Leifsonia sp. NPDC058248]|uniref:type II toxin-antitoxin system HipA family toxin n=1 Tax=Leifsonia sp. NPDC058248 TaxID=3346402 RepID=UPI0036D8C9F1